MALSANGIVVNHFKHGKMQKKLIFREFFIYRFCYVENIDKIQNCNQQSVLLQQLGLQFKTGVQHLF